MPSRDHRLRDEGGYRRRSSYPSSHSNTSRRRSRSPHSSIRRDDDRRRSPKTPIVTLPFNAGPIFKHDFPHFRPMFRLYLDIQKKLVLEELSKDEVKGRWKSFVGKWNRGELAEGWYDPQMLEKARSHPISENTARNSNSRASPTYDNVNSEDDEYGPALPSNALQNMTTETNARKHGPSSAKMQDLQVQRELAREAAEEAHRVRVEAIRVERRVERHIQKERLEEIAPRAEAGTRERQLEKKREKADSNRSFAAAAHDNADVEVKDSDLMGDGGGLDELKRMKQTEERKRSEREMRREENQAAKRAETEERLQAMREKEAKTMSMLKELARARFGGGA